MNRRQLALELLINGLLPYLVYEAAKRQFQASETEALIWATVIPGLAVIVGLIRQRKFDVIASVTLVTLVVSIAVAAATEDARLLQLRESYLSAALGGVMLLSALIGRPVLVWLVPNLVPPERRELVRLPIVKKLMVSLTWLWGAIFASELLVKWMMVETLTIGQVLAFGPIVFGLLTGLGCLASLALARRIRRTSVPEPFTNTPPSEVADA